MANVFLANKNYLKDAGFNAVLSGGDWAGLKNILTTNLYSVAASEDDALASTQFEADLGQLADVRMVAIPNNVLTFNPSRDAKMRIRGSSRAKWAGLAVNGANSIAASTLNVKNTTLVSVTVSNGDTFSIRTIRASGESAYNTYRATANVTIAGGANGSISIAPNLIEAAANDNVIECNVGDYAAAEYASGWFDVATEIYPYGSVDWGHPSFWDGKPTLQEWATLPFPVVKIFDTVLTRFWLIEFDDLGNRAWNAPKLFLPYVFIGTGYQPVLNATYSGTSAGFLSDTTIQNTVGGRRIFSEEFIARRCILNIPNIDKDEALTQPFDLQWLGGQTTEMFFVFDPHDTALMHRRAFLATLEQLNGLQYPSFNVNDINLPILEII